MLWECLYHRDIFLKFYLFRQRGREGERETNINVWLPLVLSPVGTWPTIRACALNGNRTWWPFGSQASTQFTEPHKPGHRDIFNGYRNKKKIIHRNGYRNTQFLYIESKIWPSSFLPEALLAIQISSHFSQLLQHALRDAWGPPISSLYVIITEDIQQHFSLDETPGTLIFQTEMTGCLSSLGITEILAVRLIFCFYHLFFPDLKSLEGGRDEEHRWVGVGKNYGTPLFFFSHSPQCHRPHICIPAPYSLRWSSFCGTSDPSCLQIHVTGPRPCLNPRINGLLQQGPIEHSGKQKHWYLRVLG